MIRNIKILYKLPSLRRNFIKNISVSSIKISESTLNKLLIQMPKERQHVAEVQKHRQKIKEKSQYIPGTVNLQVLGNGSTSAPATVYLFTDQSRYLFNCGEGTQRLAHEHKIKLSRLEHIFMTRASWDCLGGLPGLTLTVQDSGVPNLTLHGPPGLDEIFCGMKRFVILKNLKVNTVNCENGEDYEDQVMNVKCIPLKVDVEESNSNLKNQPASKTATDITEVDDIDYYAYENDSKNKQSPPATSIKGVLCKNLEQREEFMTCAYICKLKPKPGALNLEKCVEKGVPPGPLLGQLKHGFDIELPDGTYVKADDVRAPKDPGPVFIFLDIPNEKYLSALEKQAHNFKRYQEKSKHEEDKATLVIHFAPQNILEAEIYKAFIKKFPSSTKHLILNSSNEFSGYVAAHRIQYQLNQIHEEIFPLLKEKINIDVNDLETPNKKVKLTPECCNKIKKKENLINSILDVISLTSYNLRPKSEIDRNFEPKLNPNEYIKETYSVDGFLEALAEFKDIRNETICNASFDSLRDLRFPKILFLGTGSCIPNKTRNVSSILLSTTPNSCILLDCGEGTWGQIVRFYGASEAFNILNNLKAIYISHLHADHHIGLIGILKVRKQLGIKTKLYLFAPEQIQPWLSFYDKRIERILAEFILVSNADMINTSYESSHINEMGIKSLKTCFVKHCPHAFGCAIELFKEYESKPIKITYSGDTMPCGNLVELGMKSTILIHEATMEDELKNEAVFKMHSTVSEAISQGEKMNANFTILTHFSQRYAKLPRIQNDPGSKVGLAFDNMLVGLPDLKYLSLMYPVLKIMFSEHCEELEQKAVKRALRKERKHLVLNENKRNVEVVKK